MMTPEQYAAAVDLMVAEVIDDHLVSGLVLLTERNGKPITEEKARAILLARDERVQADLRSRLACVLEATYWDRGYDVRIAAIRGMCDLTTNGMTPAPVEDIT